MAVGARFILSALILAFALAIPSRAMQQPHPLEGEYAITAIGDEIGTVNFTMLLKRTGDKWACEFKDSPVPITVRSVSVDANNAISITADVDGQEVSINGKFDGGKFTGNWSVADGQGTWSAAKKEADRKSTRLNSSHRSLSRMPSSA